MGFNFKECDRDQRFLLPVDMRDWLPDDHLVWFVLDAVERLDLSDFYGAYRSDGWGRAAFHPQMMVGLALYAYAVGERSSRGIERRCREDVAFRIAAANHTPDHSTIARFLVRHEQALQGLFVQVLGLCAASGHVNTAVVAIDGTKMEANASSARNVTREQLEAYAAKVFAQGRAIDEQEDRLYGDKRGDEVPEHIADRARRLRWLDEQLAKRDQQQDAGLQRRNDARAQREAETGKKMPGPKPKMHKRSRVQRINTTDPDSRPMRTAQGFVQGFNAQAAISDDHFIVATDVTSRRGDTPHFLPMLDQSVTNLERAAAARMTTLVADAGYLSHRNCSAELESGSVLIAIGKINAGRAFARPEVEAMRQRLLDPANLARLKRRSHIAEPVFGNIKANLGATRFRRRGLDACRSEWAILATTHNLRRLWVTTWRLYCDFLRRSSASPVARVVI